MNLCHYIVIASIIVVSETKTGSVVPLSDDERVTPACLAEGGLGAWPLSDNVPAVEIGTSLIRSGKADSIVSVFQSLVRSEIDLRPFGKSLRFFRVENHRAAEYAYLRILVSSVARIQFSMTRGVINISVSPVGPAVTHDGKESLEQFVKNVAARILRDSIDTSRWEARKYSWSGCAWRVNDEESSLKVAVDYGDRVIAFSDGNAVVFHFSKDAGGLGGNWLTGSEEQQGRR